MQIRANQPVNIVNDIDSSGSIYCQSYENLPLNNQFLKIEYVNYSEKPKNNTQTEIGLNKSSGNSLFSFQYSDLILIIQISMFALITFITLSGKNYFRRILMSLRNYSYSISFFREKNLAFVLYNNIMTFVFLVCAGLVVSNIADYYKFSAPNMGQFEQFLIIIAAIAVLLFINRSVVRISGIVFGYSRLSLEYLFYYSNLLRILGILFLILSIILFVVNPGSKFLFIYFTIFISVVAYLVKSIRILIIFFKNKLSIYYLILYFCALEIIPVVLIIKLFTKFIQNGYSFSGILV